MVSTPSGENALHSVGIVAAASVAVGVAATWGQVHPANYSLWDNVLVAVFASLCIWAASTAPWWALGVVALAGAVATVRQEQWLLVGLAVVAGALAVLLIRLAHPLVAVASAGFSIAVLSRLEGGPFFGGTALFVLALLVGLAVIGLVHQPAKPRRLALIFCGGFVFVMLVGAAGFALAALQAKSALSDANRDARAGLAMLKDGDFIGGSFVLDAASDSFAEAQDDLSQPWALLARLVPAVAQNRQTAIRLIDSAQSVVDRAAAAADQIDPESLRVTDGQVDLAAITALQAPVADLQLAITDLQATLDEPVSPWVPDQVVERLDDLGSDADRYQTQIDNLSLAVQTAPNLLGADRPRSYFVAFSTPAETRSIGGFVGNYAILTVDQGAIELTEFGRSDDLRLAAPVDGMAIDLPADFVRRYGAFNFEDSATGKVQPMAWKNIGITPDFPTMTSVVQQMYRATFNDTIDGMILMDPYPLAQLLTYTGPQTVEGYPTPIDSTNAVDFILRGQYLALEQAERVDVLEVLAQQTITALLDGSLPSPVTLAKDLGPFVGQHRLMVWTDDPTEQTMLDAVGLSGRFPPANTTADFGITFNNAAPNKADAYLTHIVSTTPRSDPDAGDVVDVTIELTNGVDAAMPATVVANNAGLPVGTMYLYLSMYGPTEVVDAMRDGEALGTESDVELGLQVAAAYIDIAPGETTAVTFTFAAPGAEPANGWKVFVSPSAQPEG